MRALPTSTDVGQIVGSPCPQEFERRTPNGACGGDVAAYLTGARARFGSHVIDPNLTESAFVVQQVSTGKAVRVRVRPTASTATATKP